MSFDLARIMASESFTSFWYWTILVFTWARITHFSLGVGLHDVRDALKNGGQDMIDVETLIEVNGRKLAKTLDQIGVYLVAFGMFLIATIITLGFGFDFELMQATTFLLVGFVLAFLMTVRFVYLNRRENYRGEALCRAFMRLRMFKQFLGIFTIFFISFYSAYYVFVTRGF
jgi:hypothetical protein